MSTFQWVALAGMAASLLYVARGWLKGLIPGRSGNSQTDAFQMVLDVRAELERLDYTPEQIDAMTFHDVPSRLACGEASHG